MGTVDEKLTYLLETKEQIKNALVEKEIEVADTDTFRSYADKVGEIRNISKDYNITSGYHLFYSGARLDHYEETLSLCKGITNASSMFDGCKDITELNVSNLDTSNVTHFDGMFKGCTKLTTLDLSNFNTDKAIDIHMMFQDCTSLAQLNISSFNTSNVTSISSMFDDCKALKELDVKHFNVEKASSFMNIFINCSGLTELDLSTWVNEKATDYTQMFCGCTGITALNLSGFNFCKANDMANMFKNCTALTTLNSFKNLGQGFTRKTANYSDYTLDLSYSSNLTHDSLMDVINNGLYDLNLTYNVAGGGTLYRQQFKVGATNLAKLTADEIAIATNKGWNVS